MVRLHGPWCKPTLSTLKTSSPQPWYIKTMLHDIYLLIPININSIYVFMVVICGPTFFKKITGRSLCQNLYNTM